MARYASGWSETIRGVIARDARGEMRACACEGSLHVRML
jgi:hypothetical protein